MIELVDSEDCRHELARRQIAAACDVARPRAVIEEQRIERSRTCPNKLDGSHVIQIREQRVRPLSAPHEREAYETKHHERDREDRDLDPVRRRHAGIAPRPGRPEYTKRPAFTPTARYGSSVISRLPSRSAHSTAGARCAAAAIATLVSAARHPSITLRPPSCAAAIIARAAATPPHFCSFTLMPSHAPIRPATSLARTAASSATIGSGDAARTRRRPSMSLGSIGCSTNSRSNGTSFAMRPGASSAVQAAFGSTRTVPEKRSRIADRAATLSPWSSLTLSTVKPSPAALAARSAISEGSAMPIVNEVGGGSPAASPRKSRSVTPAACDARSWASTSIAQQAAPPCG